MNSLLRTLLTCVTLGMLPLGCNKPPAPATDVTLSVPAMN
jgi:hypothetical protein